MTICQQSVGRSLCRLVARSLDCTVFALFTAAAFAFAFVVVVVFVKRKYAVN